MKMNELFEKFRKPLSYVLFAGLATLFDMSVLFVLTSYFGIFYLTSAAISYIGGMIVNYSLNKNLTFKNKNKKIMLQFGLFIFVALIGLLFNQIILYFLVSIMGINYMIAKLVSVFVVMFWSYLGHNKITFGILK